MKQALSNKVAIVTGASRGIGRAIALKLAEEGAAVMLAARNAELLKEVRAEIETKGGRAAWLSLDLRKPEAPALLVEKTIEVLGGIDIVVNNAGATKRGDFLTLSEEDWTDGFALKFFGAVRLLRAAWPILKQRKGSVVNIAGVGGRTPGAQFTIGGSVNAAMLSFTKAMADVGVGGWSAGERDQSGGSAHGEAGDETADFIERERDQWCGGGGADGGGFRHHEDRRAGGCRKSGGVYGVAAEPVSAWGADRSGRRHDKNDVIQ